MISRPGSLPGLCFCSTVSHDRTRTSIGQAQLVGLQAGIAAGASGDAGHHGVRARRRRCRGPARPLFLPKLGDEFSGVFRYCPARRTGNLAERSHLECCCNARFARGRHRGAAISDERRGDASLIRPTACMAGLYGPLFSHRCDLVDCHALSRGRRPGYRGLFRCGYCDHGGLACGRGHRIFPWEFPCRSGAIRARSCDAGIFRRDAGAAMGGRTPRLGLGCRGNCRRCCGASGAGMVVHHRGVDHGRRRGRLFRGAGRTPIWPHSAFG